MATTIEQYREAKATYEKLHNQAKKDLLARFQELANELLQVQKELKEDFATKVAIPSKRKPVRRSGKTTGSVVKTAAPQRAPAAAPPNPAVARAEKKLATQRRKLDEAVKAGQDPKAIKDRIYELEDELRLAKE